MNRVIGNQMTMHTHIYTYITYIHTYTGWQQMNRIMGNEMTHMYIHIYIHI